MSCLQAKHPWPAIRERVQDVLDRQGERKRPVLESAYYGNATYVLDGDWETLSQSTKAEILKEGLHRDRVVHRERWEQRIRELLA